MTHISYECKGANGNVKQVKSLPEAKAFQERYGGTFRVVEEYEQTYCEPHVRERARWKQ